MGKLKGGPFGTVHGKVGRLVSYVLNGENIVRKIGKSSKPLTPARKANCEEMTVINSFLSPSLNFIRSGFRLAVIGTNRNAYNEAIAYNKLNALQGEYPNISIDYTKILVSKGSRPVAKTPQIAKVAGGIEFTWDTADLTSQHMNDRAMVMVFFSKSKITQYHLSGAKRAEGKDLLPIDSSLADEQMEAYISFIKDDTTEISDSVYAGSIPAVLPTPSEKAADAEAKTNANAQLKADLPEKHKKSKEKSGSKTSHQKKAVYKKLTRVYPAPS